jgi:hypothetical protein
MLMSLLVLGAALTTAAPASATSLVRRGLDRLAHDSEVVVQATVLDIHSYWNSGHTFSLTDVHARPARTLKGAPAQELEFTVMGGTVGGTTTLIVGGADLAPGADYVLFLAHAGMPGAPDRLTVRELCQGVFVVQHGRARSQAIGEPLLPDEQGLADVPGGTDGLELEALAHRVLELR